MIYGIRRYQVASLIIMGNYVLIYLRWLDQEVQFKKNALNIGIHIRYLYHNLRRPQRLECIHSTFSYQTCTSLLYSIDVYMIC